MENQEKTPKERVYVSNEEFIPLYKEAFAQKVSLAAFAATIGQAEQTIIQRVAKLNKLNKSYKETYEKLGVPMPASLGYLSQATGKSRGRKTLTAAEMVALFGLKTDSPI